MPLLKLLPRFQHAYRMLDPLAEREQWSRTQIEDYQLHQLNALWRQAIRCVPYYRGLHHEHKLPRCFSSLGDFKQTVPVLRKPAVREHPEQFLSSQAKGGRWERTSVSTGAPTRIFHDTASHRMMLHAKYRLYQCWGIDVLDCTAYLWDRADLLLPTWESLLRRIRYKVFDVLRGRLRLSAFKLDRPTLAEHLRAIERFRPRMLYGFSNALYQLAQAALDEGFRCESVKAIVMTAKPASPAMLATVQAAFGTPAAIECGATECELIAGMQPDGTLRVREDLVLVETLPCLGRYEFVITVLANDSFPLFRYRLKDLTDCPLSLPEHGFAVLRGGVRGRQDDLLQTTCNC